MGGSKVQTVEKPTPPPPPPTIEAAEVKTRDEADAFNRRQGTKANIKAGNAAAPTTQASTLLGA